MQPTALANGIVRDTGVRNTTGRGPSDAVRGGRRPQPWLAADFVPTDDQIGAVRGGDRPVREDAGVFRNDTGVFRHGIGAFRNEGGGAAQAGGWRSRLGAALQFAGRQLAGENDIDQFGFDEEFSSRVLIPLTRAVYRNWFRVQMRGLDHVPGQGPALIVANHSGTLPIDAIMLQTGLRDEHPAHRNLRLLGADLVYQIPLLGSLARRGGHIRACPDNARALLRAGKAVGVFPEGFKGIGKPFTERYQLQRFGRGGFAAIAIKTRVPIIPCAIVGAEEIYPMLGNAKTVADLLRLPYFPITPLFPWLGPLGAVPLPSRWMIEFCPPVTTDGYEPGAESDPAAVADLSGRIRGTVQRKLDDLVAERGPAFG